jgi:glyoxylase-like metal-dependent hydrolase (beta-lactamase superfamily II)
VIAKVRGYAIGGGNVLATICDLTLAAESAIFGQVGPKMGSVDPGFGTAYLARVVGEKKAREMWYLCRRYSAAEALAMGLVNAVFPDDELDAGVAEWCAELVERSPTAIALAKTSFNADSESIRGLTGMAFQAVALYYNTDESKEGVAALKAKRKPNFRNPNEEHSMNARAAVRWSVLAAALAVACAAPPPRSAPGEDRPTRGRNRRHRRDARGETPSSRSCRSANGGDLEDAQRGLIDQDPDLVIDGVDGRHVWDTTVYKFLEGEPPASVNPSLWRQALLNDIHGLFEVTAGIYQVRGYDVSNMTIIEGSTGRIVVDPLTTKETAAAAWKLVERALGKKPVSAVIFTHSHLDHFGGIEGVISNDELVKRKVPVVAPARFLEEASSENVLAGIAMLRRAQFMYGANLPIGVRGHVDTGLGKAPALGTVGLAVPTVLVSETPTTLTLDGVRFVFQYTPESEAPAEMTFYLPAKKAFCSAEIVTHTMHNILTLRGAKVRDALKWSGYIDDALVRFGTPR